MYLFGKVKDHYGNNKKRKAHSEEEETSNKRQEIDPNFDTELGDSVVAFNVTSSSSTSTTNTDILPEEHSESEENSDSDEQTQNTQLESTTVESIASIESSTQSIEVLMESSEVVSLIETQKIDQQTSDSAVSNKDAEIMPSTAAIEAIIITSAFVANSSTSKPHDEKAKESAEKEEKAADAPKAPVASIKSAIQEPKSLITIVYENAQRARRKSLDGLYALPGTIYSKLPSMKRGR